MVLCMYTMILESMPLEEIRMRYIVWLMHIREVCMCVGCYVRRIFITVLDKAMTLQVNDVSLCVILLTVSVRNIKHT